MLTKSFRQHGDTQVLDLAKERQTGRVTDNVTDATFNFTEGWFRSSGLYDINEKYFQQKR